MSDTDPNKQKGATAVVNDDGRVTAHGRNAWIWCQDAVSGARFDFPARRLPKDGVIPVPGYEVNFTPTARNSKSATDLAGEPPVAKSTAKAAKPKENGQ